MQIWQMWEINLVRAFWTEYLKMYFGLWYFDVFFFFSLFEDQSWQISDRSRSANLPPTHPPKTTNKLVDTSLVSRVAYIFCKAGDETVFLDLELCFNRTVELTAVEWEPLEGFKNGFLKGLFWGLKLGKSKAWFFSTFTLGPLNFWLTWSSCFRFHVHDVEPIRAHLFNWHAFVRGMSVG